MEVLLLTCHGCDWRATTASWATVDRLGVDHSREGTGHVVEVQDAQLALALRWS